uniref:Uncharacterized protein n=1 Tax=Takifugu rubripes TaxID=31033 RepID=H2SQ26_TAKRU
LAEDDGLCDGQAAVQVTQRRKLLLLVLTDHVELPDVVQSLLLSLQPDDVGIGNDLLCKTPHRVLEGGGEEEHLTLLGRQNPPLDADALVPVALHGDHHIGLVQHEHGDLLGVDGLPLGAPVVDGAGRPDDDLRRLRSATHFGCPGRRRPA